MNATNSEVRDRGVIATVTGGKWVYPDVHLCETVVNTSYLLVSEQISVISALAKLYFSFAMK